MKKPLLDASSAILLLKAGLLDKLVDVYSISLTRSVLHELTREEHYYGADIFHQYWATGKIRAIVAPHRLSLGQQVWQPLNSLDLGERDTIASFRAGGHDFIITDDGKAARYCRQNKIPFINALLFPRLLYYGNTLTRVESNTAMDNLVGGGRYSERVVKWAQNCEKESLLFAIP